VLLFSRLACRAAASLIFPDTPVPTQPPAKTPSTPRKNTQAQSYLVLFLDIITTTTSASSDAEVWDNQYLVTYKVNGDQISDPYYERVADDLQEKQAATALHKYIWDYFTAIIHAEQRSFVTEYSITTDGAGHTLAAVAQTYVDSNQWALEVDILDVSNIYNLTFTFIHEFGHLLTLNANQVPPSIPVFCNPDDEDILQSQRPACPQHFPGEGCSTFSSYINAFYNRFWADIYFEWDEINHVTDDDAYYEQLDNFYYKYEDQFITNYSVTTPEEDIAESWTFFIFSPKPELSSATNEKVLFFYEYPDLVQLREEILNNLCEAFPQ